jgi:hypothetical protein
MFKILFEIDKGRCCGSISNSVERPLSISIIDIIEHQLELQPARFYNTGASVLPGK